MPWILSQDLVKNPVVPFQDLIDDPEELKTNKFEVQNSFFDDESKAVHEKHGKDDGPTEEESNSVVAVLVLLFDTGIQKEPIAKEKDVKKCSEILINFSWNSSLKKWMGV